MRELISWAVALYDRIDKRNVTAHDISFMSGIKYIDNIIKHEGNLFTLYAILRPGINLSVKIEEDTEGPNIKDVKMTPCIVWGNLDNIPCKPQFRSQRNNYFNIVQKLSVCKCINNIDGILKKHYTL